MSLKSITITAAASLALVLLQQGSAEAGFLVEQGDVWRTVGDNVGSGPQSPETPDQPSADSSPLAAFLSHFLVKDAAQFGRIGCSTPGGMSSASGDSVGPSGTGLAALSLVEAGGNEHSAWLRPESSPRLPPPLATMILQPPRA